MPNNLTIAQNLILNPAGLTIDDLSLVLPKACGSQIDFADIFCQYVRSESWFLDESIVKGGHFNIDCGIGIRSVSGVKSGLAYVTDISKENLQEAAQKARSIVNSYGQGCVSVAHKISDHHLYPAIDPLSSLTDKEKISLLQEADHEARLDPRIKRVSISLSGIYEVVLIINSEGTIAADVRPLVHFNVRVIAEQNGRRESGSAGFGSRAGYQFFTHQHSILDYVHKATEVALLNLEALPSPAGLMPVVLGAGWPGVVLHEAVGHGLEGDFIRKKTSTFTGKIGQKVASDACTIIDDGTLPGKCGSLNIDDEGTVTQRNVLIENGILKGYMQDHLNAKLLRSKLTGNGRRESYNCIPIPRMTNTYMLGGNYSPEEIIGSVEKGIYAVNFSGGEVDITSGKFVFSSSEAYMIEKGVVTYPIKGATLIGDGPSVLTKVSMVGNDWQMDPGIGTCGKDGQSVSVGVGQPTLKIDELVVGGTEC